MVTFIHRTESRHAAPNLWLPHLLHPWRTVLSGKGSPPPVLKIKAKLNPPGGGGRGGPPARGPKKNLKIANQIKSNKRTPLVAPRASIHFTWSWEGDKQTNKQTNHHHHHHHSWGCPPDKRQRSPPSRGEKSR
jgi:hypothetical protein